MLAFNEIATDEREKQQGANQGKICEFCFATMGSGVRTSPGPPTYSLSFNQFRCFLLSLCCDRRGHCAKNVILKFAVGLRVGEIHCFPNFLHHP